MKSILFRLPILAFCVSTLQGCDTIKTLAPCSDGSCTPPIESISEMQALGVTLSIRSRPFPEEIEINRMTEDSTGEEFVVNASLQIYFSPTDGFENVANPDPTANSFSDRPYVYTFSMENSGEFEQIKPYNIFTPRSFLPLDGTAFGPLRVTNDPPELVVFGNHTLEASEFIPSRATHIELWFRSELNEEFTLLSRTPLSSLFAWKTYFEPAL